MSKRLTLVGLAALCALAFGAISASGASAAGKTGYTCVAGAGAANTSSHCVPGSEGQGNFGHVAIPAGEATQGTIKALGEQVLGAEIFGAFIELKATGIECIACMGENTEVGGVMQITGTGRVKFTGVVVAGSPGVNCVITSDPGGAQGVIETEPLKGENNVPTSGTVEPVSGTTVARFNIVTTPGAHSKVCNITGTYTVTGKATGAASGSTAKVNITAASGELKLNGEPAFLKGEATVEAGLTGGEHRPAARGLCQCKDARKWAAGLEKSKSYKEDSAHPSD